MKYFLAESTIDYPHCNHYNQSTGLRCNKGQDHPGDHAAWEELILWTDEAGIEAPQSTKLEDRPKRQPVFTIAQRTEIERLVKETAQVPIDLIGSYVAELHKRVLYLERQINEDKQNEMMEDAVDYVCIWTAKRHMWNAVPQKEKLGLVLHFAYKATLVEFMKDNNFTYEYYSD